MTLPQGSMPIHFSRETRCVDWIPHEVLADRDHLRDLEALKFHIGEKLSSSTSSDQSQQLRLSPFGMAKVLRSRKTGEENYPVGAGRVYYSQECHRLALRDVHPCMYAVKNFRDEGTSSLTTSEF